MNFSMDKIQETANYVADTLQRWYGYSQEERDYTYELTIKVLMGETE